MSGRGMQGDVQVDFNNTALIYATACSHAEFARMLLERGTTIDAKGQYDRTPLHWAAGNGQTEVVRSLLERCARRR